MRERVNMTELLELWPDPVWLEDEQSSPPPEPESMPLEPEDIDFYTGMPMSIPYCLRRPD